MIELTQQMRKPIPLHQPALGVTVGPYEIRRRLGFGGGGEVFEAIDQRTGDGVALKVLRGDWTRDGRRVQEFLEEAYTADCVHHPGVVRMLEWGRVRSGLPYLAMELLRGEPLSLRLLRGPLPEDEVLGILDGVLEALAAVHGAGIVHRDLKPGNIFLTRGLDGSEAVKLVDFGLAIRSTSSGPREARVSGTPAYMAPERLRGHRGSFRSDVYAVGAMTHELLAGQPPFGHEPREILEAIGGRLKAADPDQPKLSRLVARMLAPSPILRPSSAAAILTQLRTLSRTGVMSPLRGSARVAEPIPFVPATGLRALAGW